MKRRTTAMKKKSRRRRREKTDKIISLYTFLNTLKETVEFLKAAIMQSHDCATYLRIGWRNERKTGQTGTNFIYL